MTFDIPDRHVSSLIKLLDRLRPGDYRDMAINRLMGLIRREHGRHRS